MKYRVIRHVQMELIAEVDVADSIEAHVEGWENDNLDWTVGREEVDEVVVERID